MNNQRKALAVVDALATLLRKEITAIESGDFSLLVHYSGEKARLSTQLETLLLNDPQAVDKEHLSDLRNLIVRDQKYLRLAQDATAEIIQEVSNIRESRSMAGQYGRSGTQRGNRATFSNPVDKIV